MELEEHSPLVYPVFLSSLTSRLRDELGEDIRREIYWRAGGGKLVYVDDVVNTRIPSVDEHLLVADELLERIREAKLFLCLLAGESHGSSLEVADTHCRVSFFEIELFAAALFRKQIVVLRHKDFRPAPALSQLLQILDFAFPSWSGLPSLGTRDLVEQAVRVAEELISPTRNTLRETLISGARRMAEALYIGRARRSMSLQFFEGRTINAASAPSQLVVDHILNSPATEENYQQRLSRSWLAIRELNTRPIAEMEPWQLERLERVLKGWDSAGGWYGLHADMPMGCLAALNSIHAIRKRRAEMADLPKDVPVYPASALASAKYNIAKHLYLPHHRRARLVEALRDVNLALQDQSEPAFGPLTVRSNIQRRLGHVVDATKDLEAALDDVKKVSIRQDVIGATMVELGFTYVFTLRLRQAVSVCEEGIERLRDEGTQTQLARMLRKTAVVYALNGMPRKARAAREEARQRAERARAFDQLR